MEPLPVPRFMQPGSHGPAVVLLARELDRIAQEKGEPVVGVLANQMFSGVMVESVKARQREWALDQDGAFGPDTRAAMFQHTGFHFEEAVRELYRKGVVGPTVFVQPDRSSEIFYYIPTEVTV